MAPSDASDPPFPLSLSPAHGTPLRYARKKTEPTEDWTVENLLQWCLLKSGQRTIDARDEIIRNFDERLEAARAEIWDAHERAVAASSGDHRKSDSAATESSAAAQLRQSAAEPPTTTAAVVDDENADPYHIDGTKGGGFGDAKGGEQKRPVVRKAMTTASVKTFVVDVLQGPYQGASFRLRPRARSPCFVGRSAGKKFRERGISLPDDKEVSVTHGKFVIKAGKAYFVDTGSSNRTLYQDKELGVNEPLELRDDMELLIGTTLIKITLGR